MSELPTRATAATVSTRATGAAAAGDTPLLQVRGLRLRLSTELGVGHPVDGVSFTLERGRVLGLVGESGCGKSLTALALLRLVPDPPVRIVGGELLLEGRDLLGLSQAQMRRVRGDRIAMIFQEPATSLNPVYPCGEQIAEVLREHRGERRAAAREHTLELLRTVQIPDAARRAREYPHQLSGGMRQRVMIAMAIACSPALLIADEPTTALDVTIQAQILRVLDDLRRSLGMAMLHITHDLAVIAQSADDVLVMYAGRIVEQAPAARLLARPAHPYTLGLLSCRPQLGRRRPRLPAIGGTVPQAWAMPSGCRFAGRCPFATPRCHAQDPPLAPVPGGEPAGHHVACWEASRVLAEGRWPVERALA
jgi:peptide/nickel transport system ATP-binding protein